MQVTIITPDKTLYEGSAKLLQLPGTSGSFEVLVNHAPLVASLKKGKIRLVDTENKTLFFNIEAGVIQVQDNVIEILAQ